MRLFYRSLLLVVALSLSGFTMPLLAASLSVAPTRVNLAPDSRSGSVTLDNTGATATTVQVETFAWTHGNSIADLEPTRGLLAVPAVFNLPAGARQVIRVATRSAASTTVETAYRLVITEVPTDTGDVEAGVRFALRLSLPVFITPKGARAEPAWSIGDGGQTLEIENEGAAHLHIRRLTIREKASGRVLVEIDKPSYVLAQASQSWSLPTPRSAGALIVEADTNLGDLSVDVEG